MTPEKPTNYGAAYASGGRGPCAHCAHWSAWVTTVVNGSGGAMGRVAVCGRVPDQPQVVATPERGCAFFERTPGADDDVGELTPAPPTTTPKAP